MAGTAADQKSRTKKVSLARASKDGELKSALHLSAVPAAGGTPPDGSFVVAPSSPRVYRLQAGRRRLVPDRVTLMALSPTGMDAVSAISTDAMRQIPKGPPLPSRRDNEVYRRDGQAETYVMLSLRRHLIPDAETLEAHYGGESAVSLIGAADLKDIPTGKAVPSVLDGQAVDSYLRSLPDLAVDPPRDDHVPLASASTVVNGVPYTLAREAATLTTRNEHPWVLAPVTDVLYPGAVVQGASLATGRLAPLAGGLERAGGTITVTTDFVTGGAPRSASKTVKKVDLASIQDARVRLLAELNPRDGAADVSFEKHQIRTSEHGLVKMGVQFSYGPASGNLKTSLSQDVEQSSVMVFYRQVFYRVAFTPPDAPNTFFTDRVSVDDLRDVATPENPPTYLAEIDYGRMLLLTMTGSKSASEMMATLEVAVNTAAASGTLDLSAEQRQTLEQSQIQVTVVGGAGEAANEIVTDPVNNLVGWIRGGGTLTKNNPGVPLRYQARHCGLRTVVAINQTSQYEEVVAAQGVDVPERVFNVWDGPGGGRHTTGILVANGDTLHVRAGGTNWSGVWFTGEYGPDGWTTWDRPDGAGYPLPNSHPFALAGNWDGGNAESDWFYLGTGVDFTVGHGGGTAARTLWLGTNDNDPLNGDATKKFDVHVSVQRRRLANVGRAVI